MKENKPFGLNLIQAFGKRLADTDRKLEALNLLRKDVEKIGG